MLKQVKPVIKEKEIKGVVYLLMDNGSLNAQATWQLRRLAEDLSKRSGVEVHPVSLLHSNKVDPALLGGVKARTFGFFAQQRLARGDRHFVVIPLFFGQSQALADYLPRRFEEFREEYPDCTLEVRETVAYRGEAWDVRLLDLLEASVKQTEQEAQMRLPKVLVVDHGTPVREVHEVRRWVVEALRQREFFEGRVLAGAAMECREGEAYAFNRPLLADQLAQWGEQSEQGQEIVVLMLFFLPGRHAGEGGDVAEIIADVCQRYPHLQVRLTPLVGASPALIDLLADKVLPGV